MRIHSPFLPSLLAATLSLLLLGSCASKEKKEPEEQDLFSAHEETQRTIIDPGLLPNRFRQTGYIIKEQDTSSSIVGKDIGALDGFQIKVGANISTREPITLREAMRAIVRTKNMSLSWAPDVNQDLLVDIDVRADESFYEAIDHILRQLDYFHEVEGSTIVIKYRESKQYHIAMPFIRQEYASNTGVKSLDSSATLGSSGNTFDIWENLQKNLDSLIATWKASVTTPVVETQPEDEKEEKEGTIPAPISRRVSSTDSTYTIDKPVGLITVHAPRSLQKRIADYLGTLEKELYKQIVIEAKIIEVELDEHSSLGINWHRLLNNLDVDGVRYARDSWYGREDGDYRDTGSSRIHSDARATENHRGSASEGFSASRLDGYSSEGSLTERVTQSESIGGVGWTDTATGTASFSGSMAESATGSQSAEGTSSGHFSSTASARRIDDVFSMGSSMATFIASGGGMAEGLATGISLMSFNFNSFIKALQAQGRTSVLSNPKISVMNGQPALISVGKNVTFIESIEAKVSQTGQIAYTVTTDKVLSGVGMALSALVRGNNEIVMNLVPITSELVEPIEYRDVGLGTVGLPVVNMREMSTTVRISDGSMLVVGGLISEKEINDENFLPGTKNIPYFKYLFGYKEKRKIKRELIILLRPRIIH